MKLRIAARLNPLTILPGVEVSDAKNSSVRALGRVGLYLCREAYKGCVALKDHVKLAHLIALQSVRTRGVDPVVVHVPVDSTNHRARAFKVSKPVLMMRGPEFGSIFLDESLKDPVNMRPNGGPVSLPAIILSNGLSPDDSGQG